MKVQKIYVAALIGLLAMGYGWNIMLPQAIQIPLRQQPYFYSSMDFNLLYFCIFLPVLLFSIPFGTLIGKVKFSTMIIILQIAALLSCLGVSLMFDMQANPNKLYIYLLRGVYGLANQGILTLRSLLMARYFKAKFQSILSIYFSISYFISSGALSISPILYEKSHKISTVWYAGFIVSFVSFLGGLFLFIKLREIQERTAKKNQLKSNQNYKKNKQIKINSENKNKQISIQNDQHGESQNLSSSNTIDQQEKFQEQHLDAITNPKNPFWIIVLAVLFTLLSVLPIIDNLNQAFVISYNIPYVTTGFILMIVTLLIGIFLAIIGIVHQKFPSSKRISFVIVSVFYFVSLGILYIIPTIQKDISTPILHYVFVIFFLIAKAASITILWAFIYTAVIYFVKPQHLGTAYGILLTAMGFGECLGPIINALILNTNSDLSKSYKGFFLYYFCISMIPILLAVWIKFRPQFDKIDEPILQAKNQQKDLDIEKQEELEVINDQRKTRSYIYIGISVLILLTIIGVSIFLKLNFQQQSLIDSSSSVSHNYFHYRKSVNQL